MDRSISVGIVNFQQSKRHSSTVRNNMTNYNHIDENESVHISPESTINQSIIPVNCDNFQNFNVSQVNSIEKETDYLKRLIVSNNTGNDANQLKNVIKNNSFQMMGTNSPSTDNDNNNNQKLDPKFVNSVLRLVDKHNIRFEYLRQYLENENPNEDEKSIIKQNKDVILNKKNLPRKFSSKEDLMLKSIVNTFGAKNWKLIASMMPNKTSRQCRDRYMNYLAPGYIYSEWMEEEDLLLESKYKEFGSQWSKIQKFFPYRTANSIKNRFNYTVNRKIHKINDTLSSDSRLSNSYQEQKEKIKKEIDQYKQNERMENFDKSWQVNENDFEKQNNADIFFDDFEINENDFHFNYFD